MKFKFTLFFSFFLVHFAYPQELTKLNTYQDAIYLSELYEKASKTNSHYNGYESDKTKFFEVWNRYKVDLASIGSSYFSVFLLDVWDDRIVMSESGEDFKNITIEDEFEEFTGDSGNSIKRVVSSSSESLNWQTAVLNGAANFMAKRFKDESTNFSINYLFNKATEVDGLNILLNNAYSYVEILNTNNIYYYSDLNLLRYNVELDLKNLPDNAINFFKYKKVDTTIIKEVSTYYKLLKDLSYKNNPVDALNLITDKYKDDVNELTILQLLNNALRHNDVSNQLYVSLNDINPTKIETDLNVRFFYGLLEAQLWNSQIPINNIEDFVKQVSNQLRAVEILFETLKNESKLSNDDKTEYLKELFDLYKPFIAKKLRDIDYDDDYHENLRLINEKIEVINTVIPILIDLQNSIANKKNQFIVPYLFQLSNSLFPNFINENRDLFQILTFFTDLSQVSDSKEVKDLIESVALPIGSSSIKRAKPFNISLNGYVGLTFGLERLTESNSNNNFNYGLTAPIGIAFSQRVSKSKPHSMTIFLSVLDIGSLVNQNLSGDIDTDNQVKFEQFLAPGLGVFYNFGKSPFSAGLHTTYNPSKRELVEMNIDNNHLSSWRINFSLLVDIPFFNLYTKN